ARGFHVMLDDTGLVRTPVDTNARQGSLGRARDLELVGANRTDRVRIVQQVIRRPGRLQVRRSTGCVNRVAVLFTVFERPLVNGRVHLTRVVDNAATLGLLTSFHESGNREG